jgi:plastocyanin
VRPLRALLLAAPLLLALVACTDDGPVDAGDPVTEITITSTKTEFDVEAFTVPAGAEITVTYDNRHAGVPHNVHFQLPGDDDPKTELKPGPDTQTVTFTAPDEPGEYEFICDAHPGQMRGTMVVVEEGAAG